MYIKGLFLLLFFAGLCCDDVYSQQGDFCDAVTTIIRDAPNKFRNIKGKEIESNMNAIIWECGIKVPGTIGSRFVVSMGGFYEGAFFQTRNKGELKDFYDKYKDLLNACLAPQGYVLSLSDNFYPGLGDYKKIVLMQEVKTDTNAYSAPAHVTMEAVYNKDAKNYTLVIYIFEH
ncbi:MAG: hypothetical protein ACHQD8_03120 [Chitinophagales bacterium]